MKDDLAQDVATHIKTISNLNAMNGPKSSAEDEPERSSDEL